MGDEDRLVRLYERVLLGWAERHEEALACAGRLEERLGSDGFVAGRISALPGLERIADAEAYVHEIDRRDWGDAYWKPFDGAFVASHRGDLDRAAALLGEASRVGLPAIHAPAVDRSAHLAALRASPGWAELRAELAERWSRTDDPG